ncbi:MAG TPA: hypothetical protein PLX97_14575, partial [Gemmatales bacterium]|nr:hypothetical protein [Gemmatales bacterium]
MIQGDSPCLLPGGGNGSGGSSGGGSSVATTRYWFGSSLSCAPIAAILASSQDTQSITSADQGVCARVRIRLDQNLVQTRSAFDATLELINNQLSTSLNNIDLDLVIKDAAGNDVSSRFGFRAPGLTGITAIDGTGTVSASSTGRISWVIIPTDDAAMNGATQYTVGGVLHYTDNGQEITVNLAEAPITVLPNPALNIHYFHQRDVFSDDPFTDVIEPSIPYTLAVLIKNDGKGDANQLSITSAQPKIIENEKGLLVDFQIVATEVDGQNLSPSLTANFGTIGAGQSAIGRWLLTSSLQGHFIDYDATFKHLDGLGDERLSLIKSVAIHELTHMVNAHEHGNTQPDFLTSEDRDEAGIPDTV